MRCCDVEALWDEMRAGVEPRREHVLAHLRACPACQEMYAEYEGVAYCLSCLPIVEPPRNLVPKILEHIRTVRDRFKAIAPDSFATVPSPLGKLHIAWREAGITFVAIDRGEVLEDVCKTVERRLHRPVKAAALPTWIAAAVKDFFRTWRVDPRVVDCSNLTDFERAALHKAAEIPPGEVRSYGWIAREIGHPKAARAVGQAMARNPLALFFPCHRVVDANGALHNYGYGIEVKARILKMEGYRKV
ncbi:MAG: methylated-DNA--[protein]-cysteine S-methyltransferase [Candidatus Eremiobacteraeota bacterium]|nr:methylated-DNA--[protein]-cysteine S-methyltransferase [Candidatus Eremiobacteraeota bacterium]